jgi:hypothetical protein
LRAKRADSQKRENLKSEKKTTDVCPFNVVFAAVNSSLCTRVHRRAFKGKVPSHFVSKLSDDDLRIRPVGCVFSHRRCVALAVLSFLSATARRVTLGTREARALLRRAGRAVQRAALSHPAPPRFRKLHGCADSGPRPRRSFAVRVRTAFSRVVYNPPHSFRVASANASSTLFEGLLGGRWFESPSHPSSFEHIPASPLYHPSRAKEAYPSPRRTAVPWTKPTTSRSRGWYVFARLDLSYPNQTVN